MVHLFKMNNEVPLNPSQNAFLKKCLPAWSHTMSLTYKRWQDRQAYLGGRYLLLEGLKKLSLPVAMLNSLKYSEHGRPYLPLNIDFNISHSGKYILLAMSNGHRIGIDIEEIKKIEINDFKKQFSNSELLMINQAYNKYAEFFKYWTIKEAVIKADGRGMDIDLKSIVINENAYVDGKVWYLKEIKVSEGYAVHIATDSIVADEIICDFVNIPEN